MRQADQFKYCHRRNCRSQERFVLQKQIMLYTVFTWRVKCNVGKNGGCAWKILILKVANEKRHLLLCHFFVLLI